MHSGWIVEHWDVISPIPAARRMAAFERPIFDVVPLDATPTGQGLTAFLEKNISGTNSFPASHPEAGSESEGRTRARESMALLTSSLVERREAPPPYVTGGRAPRKARGGPDGPSGPTSLGPAPPGAPFPRLRGRRKKGKGGPGSPKK